MRSRYYDRYPHYDEIYAYDYGYRHYRPRRVRRYGPPRRRSDALPQDHYYHRIAFDAADPERPRRRGLRRYLDEVGHTVREAGDAVRSQFSRRQDYRGADYREDYQRAGDEEEGGPAMRRGRRFARRYKEPIVSVALAGTAVPFAIGAVGGGEPGAAEPQPHPVEEAATQTRPTARGTVEEDVGSRLAALRSNRIRESTVEGAMLVYDISRDLAEDIYDAAVANGIEPEMAFGLVKTESAFDHRAVSNVGARGLTQVMPRTARWLRPGTTIEDLYDRNLNLNMGFGYLRDLIDKYDGDVRLALLAYNRGPGTVDRVLDAGGDPDNGYADLVLEGYTDLA